MTDESTFRALVLREDDGKVAGAIENLDNAQLPDGDVTVAASVPVAGTVNDIIPGATVNFDDVAVMINGRIAGVLNRTFFLEDLALDPGVNTIEAIAVDRAGNASRTSIEVTRVDAVAGNRLTPVAGLGQSSEINTTLANPLVAEAAVTPSLKNTLLSVVAGGLVLGAIAAAVIGVSTFDKVNRK